MAYAAKLPVHLSVDAFLEWEPGDGRAWQLVDGEPQAMAPTNLTHGLIQAQLSHMFAAHFERTGSRCSVIVTPGVIPVAGTGGNVRIPDLAVTCSTYATEQPLLPDPVLLVEVLSPSNQSETWSNLWSCTSILSVREILVLRSAAVGGELLRRRPDGGWPTEPTHVGVLSLDSIGFSARLIDAYGTTRLGG